MTKAIISLAARMASTRLPGKTMAEVGGKPVLQLIAERLQRARAEVVIANNGVDEEIADLAHRLDIPYIGRRTDVMDIHWIAANLWHADYILLAGADDPFLDPAIFDMVLDRLERGDVAFVKTAGWPLGMNVWGWTRQAMEDGHRLATAPEERQHVVPFWERRPKSYPAAVLHRAGEDLYDKFRLTVDGPKDLELVRTICDGLGEWFAGVSDEVIDFLERRPEVAAINADSLHGYAARDAIYDLTPVDDSKALAAVRRYVETERRAALGNMAESPEWNGGRAAALLSVEQWLAYAERVG